VSCGEIQTPENAIPIAIRIGDERPMSYVSEFPLTGMGKLDAASDRAHASHAPDVVAQN